MAANEDELRLRLTAETLGYRKAWADVRVQTARDLGAIRATVTSNLNQTRVNAAHSLAGIRQAAAVSLGQTRVNTAQQLAQIRVNTAQQLNQIRNNSARSLGQMGSQFEDAGRRMTVGLTLPLAALATAAVRSARDIDAQVNTLRAFTGSAEAAEKRLAQLIATSQGTPGLTTGLALQLDAQLRAAQATEETINRILPAVGRLNAVQRLEDPARFTQNLIQLVTQNFERQDLKELVGQSSVAGQVIRELFNVDSPTNAQAIRQAARQMGLTTTDAFFAAFADAAARNKGLANVTESIGTQFDKLVDRVSIALRPLGLAVIDAFMPIVDVAVPIIEKLGQAFAALPAPVRTAIVLTGGFAAAVGPAVFIAGSLISTIGSLQKAYVALNALALIPTLSNLRLLSQVMQGTAGLTAGAGATAAVSAGGWIALGVAISAVVGGLGVAIARFTQAGTAAETSGATWARVLLPILSPMAMLGFLVGGATAETKQLGTAQTSTAGATRKLTAAVAEESESLKQLRRALAEVELATESRLAAAQRGYNEERITLAQFTAERIAALKEQERAELARVDEALRARRAEVEAQAGRTQGLGPHGADDKELKAVKEEIEKLEFERVKITADTNKEIRNIQSEQRVQERENEERHRESILTVLRTNAERQIDVLRDAAEQNEALRLESERKIVGIERGITEAEIGEIRRRVQAVAAGTEERARLEDELAQKLAERGRQRAEQARRVARAELEAALLPIRRAGLREGAQGAGDEGSIARLRGAAERGAASVAQTEQQIGNIIDAGFARRVKTLRDEIAVRTQHNQDVAELNAQLAQLEQERVNASEDAARRVRDGQKEDAERQRENLNKLVPLERAVTSARLATRKAMLDATRSIFGREREFITERYAIEREQIKLAHDEALSELNDREHEEFLHARRTLGNDEAFNARRLEIQKRYDALRAEQTTQTRIAQDENNRQEQRDIELQDPTSGRSLFGETFGDGLAEGMTQWQAFGATVTEILSGLNAQAGNFGTIITSVFDAVGQAVGSAVKSFVLLGSAGGGARKWAAEVIASVAQMSAVKAVFEAAEGVAALARMIFGDPKAGAEAALHFKSAAIYGSVAAISAGIGRAVAGNSFRESGALADGGGGAGGGGAYSGAGGGSEEDRTRREGRRGGMSDPNQAQVIGYLAVDVKHDDGHTERQMVKVWTRMGEFRDKVMTSTTGTAPSYS